jgi:hypothetical protein
MNSKCGIDFRIKEQAFVNMLMDFRVQQAGSSPSTDQQSHFPDNATVYQY